MKFVFDECVSDKIAKALHIMGKDTCSCKELWEPGVSDEQWIPEAAQKHWCVVTSDMLRPHRRLALRQNNGRIFLIVSKNLQAWDQFRLLVDKWLQIEDCAQKEKAPFIMRVPRQGRLARIEC